MSTALDRIACDGTETESDPDTRDSWTDEPIPFGLAQAKSPPGGGRTEHTPRGVSRRRFLGLALGAGAAGLGSLGIGVALRAGEYKPLDRAYRRVLAARDVVNPTAEADLANPDSWDFRKSKSLEARLSARQDDESLAIADLAYLIARTAGVELVEPEGDWDIRSDLVFRPVAVVVEADVMDVVLLDAPDTYYTPNRGHGIACRFRPVVVPIGDQA